MSVLRRFLHDSCKLLSQTHFIKKASLHISAPCFVRGRRINEEYADFPQMFKPSLKSSEKESKASQLKSLQNENTELTELEEIYIDLTKKDEEVQAYQESDEKIKPFSTDGDSDFFKTLAPKKSAFFNLAAHINDNEALQKLVDLGVNLRYIEKNHYNLTPKISILIFDRDVKPLILFFKDINIEGEELAHILSRNPYTFFEEIPNLQKKVNYLKSKKFDNKAIARIFTKAPNILSFKVEDIDFHLGFIQNHLQLTGDEVRSVVTKVPRLIITKTTKLNENTFLILEELGFDSEEMKDMILNKPKIFLLERKSFLKKFDLLHTVMKIPHDLLKAFPGVFTHREHRIKLRHLYLKSLSLNQYDPCKANYISLLDLCYGNHSEFCTTIAKTTEEHFKQFCKEMEDNKDIIEYLPRMKMSKMTEPIKY